MVGRFFWCVSCYSFVVIYSLFLGEGFSYYQTCGNQFGFSTLVIGEITVKKDSDEDATALVEVKEFSITKWRKIFRLLDLGATDIATRIVS